MVCVWIYLRKKDRCAFLRVGPTTKVAVDYTRRIWEGLCGCKGLLVQDTCFIPVLNEDAAGWENRNEGIQVVGVRSVEPLSIEISTKTR